jgi:hypothetical protein
MAKKELFMPNSEISYPVILTIDPRRLTNRGQLYTTQNFVGQEKLMRALEGIVDESENPTPQGFWWAKKNAIVLGEGNHRVSIAYLYGNFIDVEILGEFNKTKKIIPFNVFLKTYLSGLGLEY